MGKEKTMTIQISKSDKHLLIGILNLGAVSITGHGEKNYMKKEYRMCYCEDPSHALDGDINNNNTNGGSCEYYLRRILGREVENLVLKKACVIANTQENLREKAYDVHVPAYVVLRVVEEMFANREIVVAD